MPSCPELERCVLHRSIGMQAALRVWQSFYCEGCYSRCERYKLASANLAVPVRLLPNGRLLDGPEAKLVPPEVKVA
ncbi:MAG: hypothetical protein QM767_22335 [Anaeromyxobacter sp.]